MNQPSPDKTQTDSTPINRKALFWWRVLALVGAFFGGAAEGLSEPSKRNGVGGYLELRDTETREK